MANYQTITEPLQFPADPIKGSRFIADVFHASSPEQALAQIQTIRETSPDATHHCWAYRLHAQEQTRSSDDGEPGGSAGRPILAQIEGHDLFDIVVIVTRYYGGTKLGVGGLIRAYGGTAGKALDRVQRREVQETETLEIQFTYGLTKAVESVLRDHQLTPTDTTFDASVRMRLEVPIENINELRDALFHHTAGKIQFPNAPKPLP